MQGTEKGVKSQVMERIERSGICAKDIKFSDRLTKDQIRSISPVVVFQWVKGGHWNQKDFNRWFTSFQ